MQHDYDEYYDTKVSRPFGNSRFGLIFGSAIALVGISDIFLTILDMYISQYNYGNTQTLNTNVYTWDENPFWPSYGKGFWVGLILLATGIIGIVAFCEHTITSIYAFAALCTSSAIFSFYLLITASIPLAKYNSLGGPANVLATLGNAYYNSAVLNAVLLALGGLGFLLASIAGILSCLLVGCCSEARGYGGPFLHNYYKTIPANIACPQSNNNLAVQPFSCK